jgi:hypothetical protein
MRCVFRKAYLDAFRRIVLQCYIALHRVAQRWVARRRGGDSDINQTNIRHEISRPKEAHQPLEAYPPPIEECPYYPDAIKPVAMTLLQTGSFHTAAIFAISSSIENTE